MRGVRSGAGGAVYPELTSSTMRAGLSSRVTRKGRFSSTPTAQVRTASKPPVRTSSTTADVDGEKRVGPVYVARRRLLRQVGVEGGLHPHDERGAACDGDLLPGAVCEDRRLERSGRRIPGRRSRNSKTTRSYPSWPATRTPLSNAVSVIDDDQTTGVVEAPSSTGGVVVVTVVVVAVVTGGSSSLPPQPPSSSAATVRRRTRTTIPRTQ